MEILLINVIAGTLLVGGAVYIAAKTIDAVGNALATLAQRIREWMSKPFTPRPRRERPAGAQDGAQPAAPGGAQDGNNPTTGQPWTATRPGRTAVRVDDGVHRAGTGTGRWVGAGGATASTFVRAVPGGVKDGVRTIKDRRRNRAAQPTEPLTAVDPAQPGAQPRPEQPPKPAAQPDQPPIPAPRPEPITVTPIDTTDPTEGNSVVSDVGNINIPSEINDHQTAIRLAKVLRGLINTGMGGARTLIRKLIQTLTALSLAMQKVKTIPERVGPHIGKDTPTFQALTNQAQLAEQANARILQAIAQLQEMEKTLQPLEDAVSDVEKQATAAVG